MGSVDDAPVTIASERDAGTQGKQIKWGRSLLTTSRGQNFPYQSSAGINTLWLKSGGRVYGTRPVKKTISWNYVPVAACPSVFHAPPSLMARVYYSAITFGHCSCAGCWHYFSLSLFEGDEFFETFSRFCTHWCVVRYSTYMGCTNRRLLGSRKIQTDCLLLSLLSL